VDASADLDPLEVATRFAKWVFDGEKKPKWYAEVLKTET
jgi:hypothetical protein